MKISLKLFSDNPMEEIFGISDVIKTDDDISAGSAASLFSINYTSLSCEEKEKYLLLLNTKVSSCKKCRLAATRNNTVFGEGNPDAELMFIGEGPGADEDAAGRPFVGRAGQLLTKMIAAMGFNREEVYIANIVKCRPPNNRNPMADEAALYINFLKKQIEIINPRFIICLGAVAVNYLFDTSVQITKVRGTWRDFKNHRVMLTYHPAYLLRNSNKKKEAWIDLQLVMEALKQK